MIVQVAITLLVLLGLSAFVVDYGVLWVSRAQAQNAADAGAVAGAIARAYDDPDDPPSSSSLGIVPESVHEAVAANPVWFDAAGTTSVVSYACPPGADRCVKVDVYRDGTSGSVTLPVIFGPVLGITSQRVRATATAQVAVGNGTTCLKPWAIPDKWIEGSMPANNQFQRYVDGGGGAMVMFPDSYDPPTDMDPGSGLRITTDPMTTDLGLELTLTFVDPEASAAVPASYPISPGFLLPVTLAGPNSYEGNIAGCNGRLEAMGGFLPTESSATAALTIDGATGLETLDPGASWDVATNAILGSCAPACAPISPRLVPLAVFDVDQYQLMRATDSWCPGNEHCVRIVNMVGFFIEDVTGGDIIGRVTKYPGLVSPVTPTLSTASSFLPAITLVR